VTPDADAPTGSVGRAPACELCEATRITPWFHEDEICWVAECEMCSVPMVVWRRHGSRPPSGEREHMIAQLRRVAEASWGPQGFWIDEQMRQIPTHFHAHARRSWWDGPGGPGAYRERAGSGFRVVPDS
jgi:hypothetical protein